VWLWGREALRLAGVRYLWGAEGVGEGYSFVK
jgi:hypothetical protein